MSTVFTLNPIKLNIISTKNTIKKTVVFIGIVPNEVKNELMKIESSGKYDIKNKNLSQKAKIGDYAVIMAKCEEALKKYPITFNETYIK